MDRDQAPKLTPMVKRYRIVWDNGASACGTFPYTFDTFDEANAFGCDWASECNLRDFGTEDPDEGGYTYEIISEEFDGFLSDEEKDAHEGAEHMRLRAHEGI